ncbi:hypothetical protein [Curtobacterium sp. MCBD17_032]|uniref:hypothetical protein n=1 Tax=Curtobacterium sp. MCBD17_032 TaxID=2175659 RepID=UPI0021ACAAD3|nr:hypothetical protein [Curtobacterium sp. MCBD17_032]
MTERPMPGGPLPGEPLPGDAGDGFDDRRHLGARRVVDVHVGEPDDPVAVDHEHRRERDLRRVVGVAVGDVEAELRVGLPCGPVRFRDDAQLGGQGVRRVGQGGKASSPFAIACSEPSGVCGEIATSRTPRAVSSGSRSCW